LDVQSSIVSLDLSWLSAFRVCKESTWFELVECLHLQGMLQMKLQFGATPSKESFDICKVHCKWNYNLVQHHPRKFLDIAMRIRVVILKIEGPPQGLFSWSEGEPFLGVGNDNLQ
jgi:hypothetical protein